jgi:hypothetical protein
MKSNACAVNFSEKLIEFNRAVKKGRRSMMQRLEDASFYIKKQPLKYIAIAGGTAFAVGAIVGRFGPGARK